MTASGGVGARWCCGDNEVREVLQGSLQHNYEQWSNCSYGKCLSVCKERAQYYRLAGQIGSVPYDKEVVYSTLDTRDLRLSCEIQCHVI